MKEITFVTGNWAKIASAKQALEPLGFKINNVKMETIEIQADTMEEVAKYSAKYASDKLKTNVLKNDSGLVIPALNGFPGPYTHYVDDTLGEDGILKLMEGKTDRYAYFIEALAYCEYGKDPIVIVSKTEGEIALEKSGEYGWSWDFIFIPKGETKTMGNFKDEDRWNLWNNTGYQKLAEYLNNSGI